MPPANFVQMLGGGHPNSLGRTVEAVEQVLADRQLLGDLFACYDSEDAVVRMRASNALKRICRAEPEWLVPWIDHLLARVAKIDQASIQWTLATLFGLLAASMTRAQGNRARRHLQRNLERHDDWIVLNTTLDTLGDWAADDAGLKRGLRPQLERLRHDRRGSVARKAVKLAARLSQ